MVLSVCEEIPLHQNDSRLEESEGTPVGDSVDTRRSPSGTDMIMDGGVGALACLSALFFVTGFRTPYPSPARRRCSHVDSTLGASNTVERISSSRRRGRRCEYGFSGSTARDARDARVFAMAAERPLEVKYSVASASFTCSLVDARDIVEMMSASDTFGGALAGAALGAIFDF